MNEKEKIPSVGGEYEGRIAVIRGLINYHKRMVGPLVGCGGNDACPVIAFENDVYLDALEEALRLMEREAAGINA